jgi:hypothetical protein
LTFMKVCAVYSILHKTDGITSNKFVYRAYNTQTYE